MSTYRTFDDGPITEFSVQRVRLGRTRPERKPGPPGHSGRSYAHLRKAAPAVEPLAVTFRWMARLPQHVRPLNLLRQFPRVANTLATAWVDRHAFRLCLYDLLMDKRGNRKGFPSEVQAELMTLRSFFENTCL